MNERIKELREQAFDWVQYQLQTIGSDHSVMQNEQLQMVNEKFAELIVRECLEIVEDEDDGSQDTLAVRWAMHKIRKHFGVEE